MKKIRNWFENWISKGRTPKYLTSGKLILLSEDFTETPTIEDTRAITILPAVTKVFESTMLHNLETIVESRRFNKSQRGFRKKMSTLDNIRDVLKKARELRDYKSPKDSPNIIFFNFCKAYDSVPRDKMIVKIQDLEVSWNITMIINSML